MGFQTLMDRRSYLSLAAAAGLSATFFSAVFTLAFLAKLLTQGELRALYLLGFAAATGVGLYLVRYILKELLKLAPEPDLPTSPPRPAVAGQIMTLARAAKGRLSASEVAAATHLSVDESHRALRELVRQGVADIWISDAGGTVYVFPELFEDFKAHARSPLA